MAADSGVLSCVDCVLVTQKLQQDVKEFRNSSVALLRSWQEEYQNCLSDITAVVQKAQLDSEALQGKSMYLYRL